MRRGAVPEIVVDGQTGVLVGDVAGAVRALRVVAGLDRGRCRTRVEERFTVDTMVQGYLDVFWEVEEHDSLVELTCQDRSWDEGRERWTGRPSCPDEAAAKHWRLGARSVSILFRPQPLAEHDELVGARPS
jgi:hypothetical protein